MQHRLSAVIGVLLIGACCGDAAAAESGSRWWPFGHSSSEASLSAADLSGPNRRAPSRAGQQAPSSQSSAADEPTERWMIDSPLTKVSWPRFHMPEVPTPHLPRPQLWPKKADANAARNAWLEPEPGTKQPSPLQAVTDGARRVADSSRAAWDKTVGALTPGGGSSRTSSRTARRLARPPWWKRMFAFEDRQPQGPQTVTEWMAQERLDP
jgi:hypothetical protein